MRGDPLEHGGRVLARDEPAGDVGAGLARDHREGAAAAELVHLQRGAGPEPLQRRATGLAVQRGRSDLAPVGVLVERDACERLPVGRRQLVDVVVEAGHGDRAVGVVQARDDPGERVVRVLDGAAVAPGMQVARRAA